MQPLSYWYFAITSNKLHELLLIRNNMLDYIVQTIFLKNMM